MPQNYEDDNHESSNHIRVVPIPAAPDVKSHKNIIILIK